jgi:hypothetical protein
MDMVCLTCGEPWDMDYVLHEAPHEFTRTHSRIDRCPACPATGRPALSAAEREHLQMIASIADVCGEDIDAFVAELEDLGLV